MMLQTLPCLYMWGSTARVVRNAPSRWIAKSCFQSANGTCSLEREDDLDASIAHEDGSAELLHCARDAGLDLLLVSYIHGDAKRLATAKLGGGRISGLLIEIGDRHTGALAHEGLSDLFANAARGARHDGDFVLELA